MKNLMEKYIKKITILFMITYPIFDIKYFYNSITTLIRIIIVLFFFLVIIYLNKESRKNLKWLILYSVLVLIYTYFHHSNALKFYSLVPDDFNYSLFKECLQILKLTIPIIFLYTLYYSNLVKEDYFKVMKSWVVIISGSIIILNIFKLSYGSYSDEIILENIFVWFTNHELSYFVLASKGLFMYANQISMILMLLLPIIYYLYLKDKKNHNYFLIIVILISALMIGTRVLCYGAVILLFLLLCLYIFFVVIIKEFKFDNQILFKTLILIIIYCLILPISPAINRKNTFDNISDLSNKIELVTNNNAGLRELDKIDYIENNYETKRINEHFILESYPYQYDPDFWHSILELPIHQRINYRFLEISMVKRVIEINNNPYDKIWGITNTRIQNIFNIERDFILQYYAYGIIGMILFLGIYGYLLFILFKQWINKINYFNSLGLIMIILYLLISYASGNILNHLTTNLIFIFIITLFLHKRGIIRQKSSND